MNFLISLCFVGSLLIVSSVGGNVASYSSLCDSAFCRIVEESMKEFLPLKQSIDDGSCIVQFGQKADQLCNSAVEKFSLEAPVTDDNKEKEAIYDKKVEELERTIDAPLHVLYLKQLALLRDKAVKTFKTSLTTEGTEFEAMLQADEFFRREAEQSTRANPDWNYSKDAAALKSTLGEIAQRAKKVTEVKLAAAKQNQQVLQYMQMQQQQLQAIQQQVQGSSSPWNVGMAYRVPDSNINLSGTYQQGRAN
eukprot:gene12480-26268_t